MPKLVLPLAVALLGVFAIASPSRADAQGASCVSNTLTPAGGQATISGANNCGIEVQFNLCAASTASPEPRRFAKTLKPGERWSISIPVAPGASPIIASDYCRAAPGAPGCAVTCPSAAALSAPKWIRRPDATVIMDAYPQAAMRQEVSGRVVLACTFNDVGALTDCRVASETPPGMGFGAAAIRLQRYFRSAPVGTDGKPVAGTSVEVPISFRAGS